MSLAIDFSRMKRVACTHEHHQTVCFFFLLFAFVSPIIWIHPQRKCSRLQRSRKLTRASMKCDQKKKKGKNKQRKKITPSMILVKTIRKSFIFRFKSNANLFSNCLIIILVVQCAELSWQNVFCERKYSRVRANRIEWTITTGSPYEKAKWTRKSSKSTNSDDHYIILNVLWLRCGGTKIYYTQLWPKHSILVCNVCLFQC